MQASIGGKTLGTVKPKFNLFDFKQPMQSSIGGVSVNTTKAHVQATIGGKIMPTITQKQPLQQATVGGLNFQGVTPKPVVKQPVQPEQDIIQSFLDDETQDYDNRATVFQMLQDNVPKEVIDKAIRENTGYTGPVVPKETTGNIITQSFGNLIGGAISQAPNIVGQAGSFFIGKPVDFALKQAGINVPSLSEHFKQAGLDDKAKLQEVLGVDPESFFTQVGQFGAELGSLATGTGEAKIIAKIGEKVPAVAKGLQQLSQKAPTTYKYLKSALAGGKEMAKYDIISKGEVTPEGVGIGAGLGVALPVAGKVLSKTGEYVARKLPANLQLSGLLNPTKLNQVNDALIQEGQKTPENVGKWMIDRGMKGSKQDIVSKLETHAEQSKKAVDDTLATIDANTGKTYKNDTVKKALEQISNDLDGVAGMESKKLEIDTLLSKGEYTLTDANKAKRLIDEQYNLYKMSGGETAGTKAQGMRNVRQDIRKFIEDTAEENGAGNIRLLNNETSVAKGLSEAIARKDITDYARELLSPFAGGVVGGLYGNQVGPFKGDDYASRVGNVIVGALIGKGLASTTVKTNVASLLSKFSKKEIGALEQYISSGGSKKLSEDLEAKFNKETQLLLPAPGESSYKSPAIITPQTMEKAVIQDSKIPLKNTKYGNTKPNNTPSNNAIPSVSSSTTSNSIPKPTNLTPSSMSNGNKKILKEVTQPTKAPKQMPLKNESGNVKKPLLKKSQKEKTVKSMTDEEFMKEMNKNPGYISLLERKSNKTLAEKQALDRVKKIRENEAKIEKRELEKKALNFEKEVENAIKDSKSFEEFQNKFSGGVDFNTYQQYLRNKGVVRGKDMEFFKELYDNLKTPTKAPKLLKKESGEINAKTKDDFVSFVQEVFSEIGVKLSDEKILKYSNIFDKIMNISKYDVSQGILSLNKNIDKIEYIGNGKFNLYSGKNKITLSYTDILKQIESKPLSNNSGFINPTAIAEDITKAIKTLTPKNILLVSRQIANKLKVDVVKVQKVLREYMAKYGSELKNKAGDLFDDLADRLGVRSKFMDDKLVSEIAKEDPLKAIKKYNSPKLLPKKIEAPKELIEGEVILRRYSGNSNDFNKPAREGIINNNIERLDTYINDNKKNTGTIYRGINPTKGGDFERMVKDIKKGNIIDKGYMTATKNIDDAKIYSGSEKILLEIKSGNGVEIPKSISPYGDEGEIVIPRNTRLKYIGEYKKDGYRIIQVTQANK